MISIITGIDIVEVKRFRKVPFNKKSNFYMKNFDSEEIEYCLKFKDPYPHFAGKFAVKEAITKALKKPINFSEIHTRHGINGEPTIVGKITKKYKINVSISHEKDYAVAVAILLEN